MNRLEIAWNNWNRLDELAEKLSTIHQLHPLAKLVTTIFFLLVVVSFSKYEVLGLLPLLLYPVVIISLADLPFGFLVSRLMLIAPFAIFIGIFNPVYDHTPFLRFGSMLITGGWVSLITLLIKFFLAVSAGLTLIATTGFYGICFALNKLRFPNIFIVQLLFMYRYLSLLLKEVSQTVRALGLRAPAKKGVPFSAWGSLLGQMMLRAINRAERVYQAMLCRGFEKDLKITVYRKLSLVDIGYSVFWLLFFVLVRLVNLPLWLGRIIAGGNL